MGLWCPVHHVGCSLHMHDLNDAKLAAGTTPRAPGSGASGIGDWAPPAEGTSRLPQTRVCCAHGTEILLANSGLGLELKK